RHLADLVRHRRPAADPHQPGRRRPQIRCLHPVDPGARRAADRRRHPGRRHAAAARARRSAVQHLRTRLLGKLDRAAITLARDLAEYRARVGWYELPPQTTDCAAMLVASSLASAACGKDIVSSRILRDLARERGGAAHASLWFDAGPKLPVAEAAQVN